NNAAQQAAQQAAQAAQQAIQAAQAAADRARADAELAQLQAQLDAQRAQANAQRSAAQTPFIPATGAPVFSVKAGAYKAPITVKLKSSTRGAVIYYTTDGWTPTTSSIRYTGPINIDSTTNLQAIAIGPDSPRSLVASAVYALPSSSTAAVAEQAVPAIPDS